MRPVRFLTLAALNRALTRVRAELDAHGLWTEAVAAVGVWLVPVGNAHGWQHYGSSGEIHVPAVSLLRLGDWVRGEYTALTDVLRHEYGHAVADTHRGLFRSRRFREAFGASHEDPSAWEYDPDLHVTEYAASDASEDFAETFMLYLRARGRLPAPLDRPVIRRKWGFVRAVCGAIRHGRRRW